MKKWLRVNFLILVFSSLLLPTFASAAHTNFRANLTGAQEVPAVITNANGTAVLTLTAAGGVNFIVTVNGLSGAITGAHFHFGAAGTNGPVVFDITSRFGGTTTATGNWAAPPDSVIAGLLAGKIYVNVHTAANPGGEIRGQVELGSGTTFFASLEGTQEVPSVTTPAKGTATLMLSSVGGVGLVYKITFTGLSGAITGAHFHIGFAGQNGGVVRDITSEFKNGTATGVWRTGAAGGTGALVDSQVVALLSGRMYLNVHTAANPGGEIRGQVNLSAGIGLTAALDGSQEVPAVATNAKGTASMTLTEYGLIYNITASGLSGPITGSHFHNAATGGTGLVVKTIVTSNNHAVGLWKSNDPEPLSAVLLRELLAGNIYINLHTAANPMGEIRGQVTLKAGSGASARMDGLQEVPPLTSNAKGTATLVATGTGIAYAITVNGLSGAITGAHFHLGSGGIGTTGDVVRDITSSFTGNTASGVWSTTDTQAFSEALRAALVVGRVYLNVHTAANPTGEIRGQVLIDAGVGFRALLESTQENPPLTNNASGTGSFTLTRGGLRFGITVNGLSGVITGAHFHLGGRGQNGPVVFDITASASGNSLAGYWRSAPVGPLADSLVVALLTGRIYVNVHTAANPTGEIRGQVEISEGTGLTALLNGKQEVPSVTTNARGSAALVIHDAGITFQATVDGLSGPIAAAHFHNNAAGSNGDVVRDIKNDFKGGNTAAGVWRAGDGLTNLLLRETLANRIYFNVHTAANPTGEIRGQAVTGAALFTSVASRPGEVPGDFSLAQNYPNPFRSEATSRFAGNPSTLIKYNLPKSVRVKLVVYDMLGKKIRTLIDANETIGAKEVVWDATNDAGVRVASGIYFYQLEAGDAFTSTRKLVLMK